MSIVTRFPPSPTGDLHIGGARTALFNWLYARKLGGQMILRIEDTARERSTQESVDVILESMKWLGLTWNQGPIYQAERTARHSEVLEQLLESDHAYHCFCSAERLQQVRTAQRQQGDKPRYDRHCRELRRVPVAGEESVIRFKNPLDGTVVFDDVVRGRVATDNREMDDLILARSDATPTYNLAVVVDDMDMGVTHVLRGDDHTNNTPRQINILQALGARLPVYAHVPLILGADGQRLSKRHGAVSVLAYRQQGILPEALLNYLVRLGWSNGDQEIFDIDEMIELFDINAINKSAATFDRQKLLWINQHYIKQAEQARLAKELAERLKQRGISLSDGPKVARVVEVLRQRVQTLAEMADKSAYLYADFAQYDAAAAAKHLTADTVPLLQACYEIFNRIDPWQAPQISQAIKQVLQTHAVAMPKLAQPLRVAVSGNTATPSIDITLELLGPARTLRRIQRALEWLAKATDG